MAAKHGPWLHRILPCDVQAFFDAADAIVDVKATHIDGECLLTLAVVAVLKCPSAVRSMMQHWPKGGSPVASYEGVLQSVAVEQAFQKSSTRGVVQEEMDWMSRQISGG